MKLFRQPRNATGALLAGIAALTFSTLLLAGCGNVYRPVANPEPQPGGDPQALHVAVVVNNNNGGPGTTTQVDVSGDSNIGNFAVGRGPVHATVVNALSAYVVNKADDTVSTYAPSQTGSAVLTITLPAGAAPVFALGAAGNVFVAGTCSGVTPATGCVYVVSISNNIVTTTIPVGHNPVALAATPDGKMVYAVNQGDGTVTPITTANLTAGAPITVGASPVWAAVKSDGSTLYVANQGSDTVSVIDVAINTVYAIPLSVGTGPGFVTYDSRLRRLYVANTGAKTITVFNADQNPPAAMPLATITVGNNPTTISPLADGTRVYVSNAGCQDRLDLTMACTGNTVSVVDTTSLTLRKNVTVGTGPVWLDSSPDSIRVVVVNRDSNNISSIRTSDDTVVSTLPSASPTPVFVSISR